ncbi:MAG: hypothetical protein M3N21_04085 [Actinomycetota bacterium]|nr:hypothetical protein [Actinomycetota bacterium]
MQDTRSCEVINLAAHRDRHAAAIAAYAGAPVRYLPDAFLLATEGLFPGFALPELRLLRKVL